MQDDGWEDEDDDIEDEDEVSNDNGLQLPEFALASEYPGITLCKSTFYLCVSQYVFLNCTQCLITIL